MQSVPREWLDFLRQQFPKDSRIQLTEIGGNPRPISRGSTGKLDYIDDAGQFHAFAQVVDGAHVLVKFKYLYRSAWVTSGLVQLLQDVFQCRHAHGGGEVAFRINLQTQLPVGNSFPGVRQYCPADSLPAECVGSRHIAQTPWHPYEVLSSVPCAR